jgi:hypothetical protein
MYKEAANKMLVKVTFLVYFINIYEQLLCQYSFDKKFLSQTLFREKLSNAF